jgi:hypothetical protein
MMPLSSVNGRSGRLTGARPARSAERVVLRRISVFVGSFHACPAPRSHSQSKPRSSPTSCGRWSTSHCHENAATATRYRLLNRPSGRRDYAEAAHDDLHLANT